MRKQTTEKIKRGDYSFEKTGDDYPKNAPNCHFFKVGVDGQKECGPFGENSENKACCSRREEIIIDYKLCCTKHEGGDPDRYWHCRMRLSKSGNMSDENRLKLREMELRKVGIKTSGKILERVSTVRWWNKPWIIIVGLLGVIATIIALWWGFWVYHNPPSPEEVISDPELGISNIFIDYFDHRFISDFLNI